MPVAGLSLGHRRELCAWRYLKMSLIVSQTANPSLVTCLSRDMKKKQKSAVMLPSSLYIQVRQRALSASESSQSSQSTG